MAVHEARSVKISRTALCLFWRTELSEISSSRSSFYAGEDPGLGSTSLRNLRAYVLPAPPELDSCFCESQNPWSPIGSAEVEIPSPKPSPNGLGES